jgi:hypothetical protein
VKCCHCSKTHAIIPSFSLPGTSLGTKEVEQYLINKHQGMNRHEANKDTGIKKAHTFNIDNSFFSGVNKAKAIFVNVGDHNLGGLPWIYSVLGNTEKPIFDFNCYCLKHNINCIFFSRSNIIIFKPSKSNTIISLNNGYSQTGNINIDSS